MPRKVNAATGSITLHRSPAARRAAVFAAAVASAAALAGPAQANIGVANSGIGVHGALDGDTTFPTYYEDADGMRLVPCTAAAPCAAPGVPAGTFFDEGFYWSAGAFVGTTELVMAQEATFDGSPGNQSVFGRWRVRNKDLPAGQTYRITTPFGSRDILTDDKGLNVTVDEGCTFGPDPADVTGGRCVDDGGLDIGFGQAANSDIGPNFLQWDRSATGGGAPPAGFIADGNVLHKVVGSTYHAPGETTPANYFRVERVAGIGGRVLELLGQTDLFSVVGQLDGAPVGQLVNSSGDLGKQRLTTTGTKTVTFTNAGGAKVDLDSVAVTGADAADFTLLDTDCDGAGVDPAQTCTADVEFAPTTTGDKSAAITITDQGGKARDYPLAGTGTEAVASVPAGVSYGSQFVAGSTGRTVVVTNSGTAPLDITSTTLGGAAGQFVLGNNDCVGASVEPGQSCSIEVFFTPTAVGAQNGSLTIVSNGATKTIALSGTGVPNPNAAAGGLTSGGNAGTGPGAASPTALKPLTLGLLSISPRNKRANVAKKGLRIVARLNDGTQTLRIRVYRKKRNGTKSLLAQGFRAPSKSGLYRTTLTDRKLRRDLTVGSYELEVTPGRSSSDLGNAAKYAFKVVKK